MGGERGRYLVKKVQRFYHLSGLSSNARNSGAILESKRFQLFVYKEILNEFDEILGLQMMKHSSIQLI